MQAAGPAKTAKAGINFDQKRDSNNPSFGGLVRQCRADPPGLPQTSDK